jgi:hypothetical protein
VSSYPKRLIEVDLPIKRISAHARREKSIRHGHISTLHIWWARRPLAACRAVLCAALWPDPADEHCPQSFRETASCKIAQGLGAHLEQMGTLVQIKGNKARLLPVAERSKALFGKEGPSAPRMRNSEAQLSFLDEVGAMEKKDSVEELGAAAHGATVLDRVHQAMLLFASGRSEALRRFLVEEGVGQEARFWRLAQALSALYLPQADEKRWVDGVLARKKGLGF